MGKWICIAIALAACSSSSSAPAPSCKAGVYVDCLFGGACCSEQLDASAGTYACTKSSTCFTASSAADGGCPIFEGTTSCN